MNLPVISLGLIPGLVILPVTIVRAWLELNQPDGPATKLVSANWLGGAWILVLAILMLRRGASLRAMVKTLFVFSLAFRIPIGVVYALAWANKWTTVAGAPSRYIRQIAEEMRQPSDASPLRIFFFTGVLPVLIHTAIGVVVWFLVRVIAFRRRPPVAGVKA